MTLVDQAYPSPELIECPFPFYAALREQEPVHRLPGGDVLVTGWAEIEQVVRRPDLFSSAIGPRNGHILGGPRVGGDDAGPWPLPFSDDPAHAQQRHLCRSLVARERLTWMEPVIRRIADELLDAIVPLGRAELRSAFADSLPRRVMMEAFAIDAGVEARIVEWSSGPGPISSRVGSDAERDAEIGKRAALADFFRDTITERHARPGDDYLSELVALQVERDGQLDMPYLLAEVSNLFAAGNVTTAHMLASTTVLLLQHPDVLERVRADRTLLEPLVEESLRIESPVQWTYRVATRDTEVGGVAIAAGTMVLVAWGSANRDDERFGAPEAFDIDRPGLAKTHLGFGFGTHRCIGAPLARLEGRVALDRLLTRLPGLRAAPGHEDPAHTVTPNQRAPLAVHVVFATP